MKITVIYSAMPNKECKLNKVTKIITDTLSELGFEDIDIINLNYAKIPFYDGTNSEEIINIANSIRASKGVIFATTASFFTVNAQTQVFLEHILDSNYTNILEDKNCFTAITSDLGGERYAGDFLSKIIGEVGGFDAGKIMIGKDYLDTLEVDETLIEMIEKQVEDFYRILKQNRKFFIPTKGEVVKDLPQQSSSVETNDDIDRELELALSKMPQPEDFPDLDYDNSKTAYSANLSLTQTKELLGREIRKRSKTQDLYEKYNFTTPSHKYDKDINEISKFYAKKYVTDKKDNVLVSKGEKELSFDQNNITPRQKSCKQLTQSLPHYFKPQLDTSLEAVLQLIISGTTDSFEGYLTISNGNCTYSDGKSEHSDITIMSDSKSWSDILLSKNTAQKAFMIGKLKVRGNFVLLSKFDQMFTFENIK